VMILVFVSKTARVGEGFSSAFYMQGQFEERRQTGGTDLKQVVRIRPVDSQFLRNIARLSMSLRPGFQLR